MARQNRTGVRGLSRESSGRYRLDMRWRETSTGQMRTFTKRYPAGAKAEPVKRDARALLNKALGGDWDPHPPVPEAAKRLADLTKAYLEWAERERPATLISRRSLCKIIAAALPNDPVLADLCELDVERLKRARRKDGAGPASTNRAVAQLRHMVNLGARWKLLPRGTAAEVRDAELLEEPPGRVRELTPKEEDRLLAELPEEMIAPVTAALLCGVRRGGLLDLLKDDVDLKHRRFTLRNTKTRRFLKAAPLLPISDDLAKVFEAAMARSKCDHVFVNKRGKPWSKTSFSKAFQGTKERAGIADVVFHDTRHTFASRILRRGARLEVVGKLLTHSTLQQTLRYAHIGPSELDDAVALLGKRG